VPGVMDCRHVRVRQVGPVIFVDMVIEVPRTMSLEQAHATVSQVEDRIRAVTAAGRYRGSLRAFNKPSALPGSFNLRSSIREIFP
jgi:hypothetical protein